MIILGIDPGLATVGYGFVRCERGRYTALDYGALITPAGQKTEYRLAEIYENTVELIKGTCPHALSIEKLYFNTNEKTAVNVCQARGVILLAAAQNGIPIFEYTPLQIKQAVTGHGRAEKKQIMYMVTKLLNLKKEPHPDDTADALAAALCHAFSSDSALFGLT
ncbi:MAG: crossover junction endodeoxyribonuclease RuvC [Eubacteriales bacterium]